MFFVFEILNFENRFYFLPHITTHFQPNTSLLNSSLGNVVSDIYVGSDGKLHKVVGGADSVIPFKKEPNNVQTVAMTTHFGTGATVNVVYTFNNLEKVVGITSITFPDENRRCIPKNFVINGNTVTLAIYNSSSNSLTYNVVVTAIGY